MVKLGAASIVPIVCMVSCSAPLPPKATAPVATAHAPTASGAAAAPAPVTFPSNVPCAAASGVLVRAEDTAAQCPEGSTTCFATVPLEVWSCDGAIVLEMLEVTRETVVASVEFTERNLLAGQFRERAVPLREGDYVAVATYRREGEAALQTARTAFRVTNPKRDAAMRECEACRGQWGTWGLAGWEGCNCRTSDGAKPCRDGDACEGRCLFDRFEVIREASGPTCVGGTCTASLALGVPVGRCSEFRAVFGCNAFIPPGASTEPPRTLPARMSVTCVD